jgi:hypothetical protein
MKSNQRNPKCRKLDHTQTEEDGIILEDGEDLTNEPEEEEVPEEEAIEVGSDNEDSSDHSICRSLLSLSPERTTVLNTLFNAHLESTKTWYQRIPNPKQITRVTSLRTSSPKITSITRLPRLLILYPKTQHRAYKASKLVS